MPNYQTDLSAEFVREILDYDPDTGIFRWKFRLDRNTNWNTRWVGKMAGYPINGHVRIQVTGKPGYYASRLAWLIMTGEWPPQQVDHHDTDRGNNRWINLRLADNAQNNSNRGPQRNNSHGFKGIYFHKKQRRWYARITSRGQNHPLGGYATPEEAAAAYAQAAREFHGEFARVSHGG